MFGAPFADIADLRPGDEIWAVTGQYPNHFEFRVTDVRRAGDPLPAPLPSDGSRLTLVTSEANGWRTGWAPSRTVYVDATLVKPKTAQPVGGHLAAVPDEENAMQADTSGALIPTVFWLQGLLVATLGAVWAWRRWGIWQTWIVAVPTILALLWGATSSASLLLPNLV
jgi:sortase A